MGKTKAKPSAGKKRAAIPEAKLNEIVERLRSGKSRLIAESRKLGYSDNNALRAALRQLLGASGYTKMIAAGMKNRFADWDSKTVTVQPPKKS